MHQHELCRCLVCRRGGRACHADAAAVDGSHTAHARFASGAGACLAPGATLACCVANSQQACPGSAGLKPLRERRNARLQSKRRQPQPTTRGRTRKLTRTSRGSTNLSPSTEPNTSRCTHARYGDQAWRRIPSRTFLAWRKKNKSVCVVCVCLCLCVGGVGVGVGRRKGQYGAAARVHTRGRLLGICVRG